MMLSTENILLPFLVDHVEIQNDNKFINGAHET